MGGSEAEEQQLFAGPDDRSLMIIKGKRTKRLRTPCRGGAATGTSSSSVSAGGGGGGDNCDFSTSSSSGTTAVWGSTEEEEDMAHCLIMLARGPRRRTGGEFDAAKSGSGHESMRSSKKFSEVVAATGTGGGAASKAGFYVYECKTCSRTFPSFQALGGHRASHSKPRAAEDTIRKSPSEPNSDEDEEEAQMLFRKIAAVPPVVISSIPNFPSKLPQASRPKIHECSICGSEFSSGQALGGHMRRHRAAAAPPALTGHVTVAIDSMITTHHRHDPRIVDGSRVAILSLDLNLPAPEDEPKFQFTAAPARKPLLFSAPALVDCHY